MILCPAWHPTSCFQNFSLAFSYFTGATHRTRPPARPQRFLGGGGFLASMGPFQHKLFCDYILLSARRALSKTGGLITHKGRLPTPSLARCPLMSRAATAEGPHSTWHLGNTSLWLASRWRAERSLTIPLYHPLHNPSGPSVPPTADGCASCICTCSYTACLPEHMYGRTYSIRIYACIRICMHVRDVYTSLSLSLDTTFCNDDISYLPQCLGPFLHHLWVRLGMMYCSHSPQSISYAAVCTGII